MRSIIDKEGEQPQTPRKDRKELDAQVIETVYRQCQGWVKRTHEILTEEKGLSVGYSTLTRRLREMGLATESKKDARCEDGTIYVKPGEEMQQDTSPYIIKLSGKPVRVTASGLYLRYSKMRYVKFYLTFDRFAMKCFFSEALAHWEHSAPRCVIDNTNLAVLRGTGENAVMVPEMAAFARSLGFHWKAHRLRHSNRKGGKERNFWTLETNFFPGREFRDLADLNRQAIEWATVRFAKRPQSDTKLIPAELFETEKPFLQKLPPYIEPPYRTHDRRTDRYGYVGLRGNFYWVPGTKQEDLRVVEYAELIKIYRAQECLIEHVKVPEDQRGKEIKPEGVKVRSQFPQNRKLDSGEEELRIKKRGKVAANYLEYLTTPEGAVRYRHKFIRDLELLSRQLSDPVFLGTLSRAQEYGIRDIPSLERIASQILHSGEADPMCASWEQGSLPLEYQDRPAYRAGCFSGEPDLERYGKLLEGKNHDQDDSKPK